MRPGGKVGADLEGRRVLLQAGGSRWCLFCGKFTLTIHGTADP